MRFLIFIFAFLFIVAIFFVDNKILNAKFKILLTAIILCVGGSAYFYENFSANFAKNSQQIVNAFNAGKSIKCRGESVESAHFTYSFSLNSFIAKKDAPHPYNGKIYEIKECEL
ncbi:MULTISPECIES: hypothetical protein [unclassified Campylobacter]|uniref:hypothetical protein n=1 Tax=unclassified Campylobacter TaxID=2593542 RepID=UPI0022E9D10B|nr:MULTISPECIES: hypothetical protein [unclassified Campylobacter]MDA3073568.1 hypothetical protein [Campylobacter sp. JMF_10 EL2]